MVEVYSSECGRDDAHLPLVHLILLFNDSPPSIIYVA
jgi:hypothetical protein